MVSKKLIPEVLAWAVLGMIIVIASIVLLNFKSPAANCPTGYTYNVSAAAASACYLDTNVSQTVAASGVPAVIDAIVAGIAEPQNWVTIVIISLIGISIIVFFIVRSRKMRQ